ncbi:MAG: U32 family peptidase [Treponema sp.]|jgi:putative protease|nr:U32 family peptidase [Treponema sp.]
MSLELLAPAGSPEALDAAIGEGADAVYLGLKNFNARMRSANFTYARFEAALQSLRRTGKKLYVTVNTVFEQREADRMYQLLKYLSTAGPDALIVQDFGVAAMVRSEFPSLKMHASTQMNIASARGANALSRRGVSRVVLARELSCAELQDIRSGTNVELEVFVHGALCVSASGLCLFSSYLGGKSANRGMCTQACRRLYHRAEDGGTTPESGYYFSPGDLQLLERLPGLAAAGINALKIEGRMKSAAYVGTVVAAYRLVLDAISDGGEEAIRRSIAEGQGILRGDFARSKTTFYFDPAAGGAEAVPPVPAPGWLNPAQDGGTGISLGAIQKVSGSGEGRRGLVVPDINAAGMPAAGDSIRLHRRDDSERVSHKLKFSRAAGAENGGAGVWISIPDGFGTGDRVYLIQTRAMSKRHVSVIAHNMGRGHSPGHEKAPLPELFLPRKEAGQGAKDSKPECGFPPGLYVAVSRTEDLFIVQSSRPVRVMLSHTRKSAAYLLSDNKPPLPFKAAEIILVLDPYFPQQGADALAEEIRRLMERGYCQFVLNNPGHFSLFHAQDRRVKPLLIAGPWLYMFNSWAVSFIASLGSDAFISPLENNRQNLERTLSPGAGGHAARPSAADVRRHESGRGGTKPSGGGMERHSRALRQMFFVPVFAWPPLFRIRADLGPVYDFSSFSGGRGENFSLVTGPEGSLVLPEKPFSITDKIAFLKKAGFSRFIIDLSGPVLKKSSYRDLMRAVTEGVPLPNMSRFNWKDGFYQNEETAGEKPKKEGG